MKLKVEIASTHTLIFSTQVHIIFSINLTLSFISSNALKCFHFMCSSDNAITCIKMCFGHNRTKRQMLQLQTLTIHCLLKYFFCQFSPLVASCNLYIYVQLHFELYDVTTSLFKGHLILVYLKRLNSIIVQILTVSAVPLLLTYQYIILPVCRRTSNKCSWQFSRRYH